MNFVWISINASALWALWWCSICGLIAGHEVRTWRSLAFSLALLGTMVASFTGAIAVGALAYVPNWWQGLLHLSTAAVAVWLYEYRFGVGRHLRMLRDWAVKRWASLWSRFA